MAVSDLFYVPGTIGPISEAMLRLVDRAMGRLPPVPPDLDAIIRRESVPSGGPSVVEIELAVGNGAALVAVIVLLLPLSAVPSPHGALVDFAVAFVLAVPVTGNLLHIVRYFIARRMVADQWRRWHEGERDLPNRILSSDRDFLWQAAASLAIAALFAVFG